MEDWILGHEPALRLGVFLGLFALLGVAEAMVPRRRLTTPKGRRWARNVLLTTFNTLLVRSVGAVTPVAAVVVAVAAEKRGFGALHLLSLPRWATVVLAVIALDLAIYVQHVVFHFVPVLWRLHEVHHADLDIDVTTGARFHPLEILLSMGIKCVVVALLGAPAVSVIAFEVLLNATAMFSHSNLRLPAALDRLLRLVVVTPDMHRVHHSVVSEELNTNFGFNLPWWDRVFRTYKEQPRAGHEGMMIGVERFRETAQVTLGRLFVLPFRRG